jgi:uncharacterized protein YbjT (DUF2867 family)
MMKEFKSALLVGATGVVGSACLDLLLKNELYDRVIILTRREINFPVSHPKLIQHVIDFSRLSDFRNLIQADHIFCTLGTTMKIARSKENFYQVDFSYPLEIAKAGLENGAKHFLVVTSIGADSKSSIFYSRVKGELEEALNKLEYPGLSIFRPSLLLGDRAEARPREEVAKFFNSFSGFLIPKKYKPIQAAVVANAMILVASEDRPEFRIIESDEIQAIYHDNLKK